MNFFYIHFLLYIFFYITQIACKTVIMKFNQFKDNLSKSENINSDISIYSQLFDYILYTIINIGDPNQKVFGIFNSASNIFVINSDDNCNKITYYYNYSFVNSKTSKIIYKIEGDEYAPGYLIINDSIKFDCIEKNERKTEIINYFQFKFEEAKYSPWGKKDYSNKFYCANIGFQINREEKDWTKFIKKLKDLNAIDSYKITMNYTLDNEGYFYIGDFPHEYDQINFKEFQLTSTYAIPRTSFCQFRILMDDIHTKINETQNFNISYKEVFFHLELGLIICPVDYFNFIKNVFFKFYLNNSICSLEMMTKNLDNYYMIVCQDSNLFDVKSFPSIFFYHSELNKTFILDYHDLFYKENNKYYFLIIYSSFSGSYWKLGKPFLKKYQITLDLDSKKIYFYNFLAKDNEEKNINEKNNNINLKEILLIIFCSVLLIILVILVIKLLKKNRKKRANELKDDEYEYMGIDNTKGEDKQIINNDNNSKSINE